MIAAVFGLHAPFAEIVARSVIVYVVIVLLIRVMGRRQLGQMTPFDLVLILLIANAVQNAMVGTDSTIFGGLVAAAALLTTDQVLSRAVDRIPRFRRIIQGQPILLVNDGRLIERHVVAAGLSEELVVQAIREHGFENLQQVQMAVLEIDGTISIVPTGQGTVRTRHRVRAVRPGGN
ncbi:MAG: DUF421 domain-containing protein [Dehalococcoidia bacterium]|nr:DUF421 domain-containing protein [Dehalococcoidia bacterium]